MHRRLFAWFCFPVLMTCLWSNLQTTQAAGSDIWIGCSCIPIVSWQNFPTSAMPVKPQPARPKLAQTTAAPPSAAPLSFSLDKRPENKPAVAESAKPEPAGKLHGAAVREEGPFYDTYSIALKPGQKPVDDQCTVTFTNLSERTIKLMLENQERTLPAGESTVLPVKRQFVWRMEGREAQNEQVGTGDYAVQIVIRR
jgi:hypothetical protein